MSNELSACGLRPSPLPLSDGDLISNSGADEVGSVAEKEEDFVERTVILSIDYSIQTLRRLCMEKSGGWKLQRCSSNDKARW